MHVRKLASLTMLLVAAALFLAPSTALGEGFISTLTWSTQGSLQGQISLAVGLHVHNGQIYVTDYASNRVVVFTTDGSFVRQWPCVSYPTGIVIDPVTEAVYVGGYFAGIEKYTMMGDALGTLAANGSAADQVGGVEGLAIDQAGTIYATDVANDRVQVYSRAGAHVRSFGGPGTGDGQFNLPAGIGLDATGNVYVVDYPSRVEKFANDGTFLAKWGTPGSANGQFNNAVLLAVDSRDHVFVTDRGNDRIQEFTAAGAHVRNITLNGFSQPQSVTFGPRNSLYSGANQASGLMLFRWDWDNTPPVLTHDYDGEWHSHPFNVTFSAKDDYTAVPWLRWTLNSVDWNNTGLVQVPTNHTTHAYDGFYKPLIGAGDSVSNWVYKTLNIKIDTRAPRSTVSGVPAGWTNQQVLADISAIDYGSGVDTSYYDLDGNGLTEVPADGLLLIESPGIHTLEYWSQDNCVDIPNQETAKTVQVLVDFIGPDAMPTNNVTVRKGARATFKYTLNDDFSPTCTVKLVIKKKSKVVKTVNLGTRLSALQVPPHAYSKAFAVSLPLGTYNWTVIATDLAGNKGSYAPKRLTVK